MSILKNIQEISQKFKILHYKLINNNLPAIIKIWQQCLALDGALQKNWNTAEN